MPSFFCDVIGLGNDWEESDELSKDKSEECELDAGDKDDRSSENRDDSGLFSFKTMQLLAIEGSICCIEVVSLSS